MHKRIKLFIVIAVLFATACNDQATDTPRKNAYSDKPVSKADSLRQEVMEGHDVGMAKIIYIRRYSAQIQLKLDSLNKLPPKQQDKQYQQTLVALHQALQNADKGMSTWMDKYKDDTLKDNEPLRIQYLESEKVKVDKVKTEILESLSRADSLLKQR
ncbi:MAG: viral A-type inclusion protein [Niastella sp.]|nr:viral A-type inclusion protein [Niastella sp.]